MNVYRHVHTTKHSLTSRPQISYPWLCSVRPLWNSTFQHLRQEKWENQACPIYQPNILSDCALGSFKVWKTTLVLSIFVFGNHLIESNTTFIKLWKRSYKKKASNPRNFGGATAKFATRRLVTNQSFSQWLFCNKFVGTSFVQLLWDTLFCDEGTWCVN